MDDVDFVFQKDFEDCKKILSIINDEKGKIKVETEKGDQKSNQVIDLKVDQKAKTFVSENEYGKAELTYYISGDVLTIKDVKNSLVNDKDMFTNYMKVAKLNKL